MQTPFFHFFHYSINSCAGYRNYLEKSQNGNWIVFNIYFLFFQGFYLIYHKMYREAFLYSILFGSYFSLLIDKNMNADFTYVSLFVNLFFGTLIFSSFFFYKIYEMKINRVITKTGTNYEAFYKKITPYGSWKSFLALSLGWCAFIYNTLFICYLFILTK